MTAVTSSQVILSTEKKQANKKS